VVSFRAQPLHTNDVRIRRGEVAAVRLETVETGKSLLFRESKRGSLSEAEGGHCNYSAEVSHCEHSFLKRCKMILSHSVGGR